MRTKEDPWGEDEGARSSSLLPVHKLVSLDIHYDLQLRRDLEIANTRTQAELGPLPRGGLSVTVKRKPSLPGAPTAHDCATADVAAATPSLSHSETATSYDSQETENMTLRPLAMAAAVGAATALAGAAYGGGSHSTSAAAPTAAAPRVPEEFRAYSSTPVGKDSSCVVGSVADEDGMYARPFVYLAEAGGRKARWAKYLSISEEDYEGRATHCLSSGDHIYVLLQVDTQAPRSLSQTLLSVVKLRLVDGVFEKETDVLVPETHGNYSAWVKRRDGSFKRVNDELVVAGKFRYMDAEDDLPFSAAVKP